MSERRYNEDEVALILSKAVEARPDDLGAPTGTGLTLAEVREIAAEVGIEADRIETAARDLEKRTNRPLTGSALGMRTTVQLERVVPVRLEEEHLPHLLDLIRNELARQGIVEEVLGGIEWRARSGMGGRYISIRPDGDQTRIRVLGNYRDGLLGFTLGGGPMMAAATGAFAAGVGLTGALVVVPIALAGGAISALVPWHYLFDRESRSMENVIDALERRLIELG